MEYDDNALVPLKDIFSCFVILHGVHFNNEREFGSQLGQLAPKDWRIISEGKKFWKINIRKIQEEIENEESIEDSKIDEKEIEFLHHTWMHNQNLEVSLSNTLSGSPYSLEVCTLFIFLLTKLFESN